MIRQQPLAGDDVDLKVEDRSMRFVEYILAIIAIVAAAILAFLR